MTRRDCAFEAGILNLVVGSLGSAPGSVGDQTTHAGQGFVQALFGQPSRESPCHLVLNLCRPRTNLHGSHATQGVALYCKSCL